MDLGVALKAKSPHQCREESTLGLSCCRSRHDTLGDSPVAMETVGWEVGPPGPSLMGFLGCLVGDKVAQETLAAGGGEGGQAQVQVPVRASWRAFLGDSLFDPRA